MSLWTPLDSDMEEFDSKDISTSKDEACVPLGGECHEDDICELVKGDEVDDEEETQKTKGTKRLRVFWQGRENKVASH